MSTENNNEQGLEQGQEVKTYTQEELNEILQSETDRRVTQALKKHEEKFKREIENTKKLAGLSAQEKFELQLKEKEDILIERENKLTILENKTDCIKILSEKNIPIEFSDIIIDINPELVNERIKTIEKLWKDAIEAEVTKRLPETTPHSSNGSKQGITKEQFKTMGLSDRQNLARTNRTLFDVLSNS